MKKEKAAGVGPFPEYMWDRGGEKKSVKREGRCLSLTPQVLSMLCKRYGRFFMCAFDLHEPKGEKVKVARVNLIKFNRIQIEFWSLTSD